MHPTQSPIYRMFKLFSLPLLESWQKVLIGLFLGIAVGLLWGKEAQVMEPLGVIFLNLIKMITMPLIFFTLVYGITNIETGTDLRRIGGKAIVAFMLTAMLAAAIGMLTATCNKHINASTMVGRMSHILKSGGVKAFDNICIFSSCNQGIRSAIIG